MAGGTYWHYTPGPAGHHVGDTFKVPGPNGQTDLTIEGVFNTVNQDQVLVPLKTAQDIFQQPGLLTAIDVIIKAGADRDQVKDALAAKLGSAYSVGSAAAGSAFSQDIQLALIIFNVFGILTLFMPTAHTSSGATDTTPKR